MKHDQELTMWVNILVMIFIILLLASCSSNTKPPAIVKPLYVYKAVTYPEHLLAPCSIPKPMSKDTYLSSTYMQKENLLTNYILSLLTSLDSCNKQITTLRDLQTKYQGTINAQ